MNEGACLLELGVGSVEDIDKAARNGLNHPMGPLELMDMTGIDIALAALGDLYRNEGPEVPAFSAAGQYAPVWAGWDARQARASMSTTRGRYEDPQP